MEVGCGDQVVRHVISTATRRVVADRYLPEIVAGIPADIDGVVVLEPVVGIFWNPYHSRFCGPALSEAEPVPPGLRADPNG